MVRSGLVCNTNRYDDERHRLEGTPKIQTSSSLLVLSGICTLITHNGSVIFGGAGPLLARSQQPEAAVVTENQHSCMALCFGVCYQRLSPASSKQHQLRDGDGFHQDSNYKAQCKKSIVRLILAKVCVLAFWELMLLYITCECM